MSSPHNLGGDGHPVAGAKLLTSCDACRNRKVRCIKRRHSDDMCINCERRSQSCQFSHTKIRKLPVPRPRKSAHGQTLTFTDAVIMSPSSSSGAAGRTRTTTSRLDTARRRPSQAEPASSIAVSAANSMEMSSLDHVSPSTAPTNISDSAPRPAAPNATSPATPNPPLVMIYEKDVSSSCLAFFSDRRIAFLSRRLGHTRVTDLIRRIDAAVQGSVWGLVKDMPSPEDCEREANRISLSHETRSKFITSYFEEVHPMYPFLDWAAFEERAFGKSLPEHLSADKELCALYHAVMGIGSLYHDCGSFSAFSGTSWCIFRVSLSLFPRLVFGSRGLVTAQALTAMAIFGSTYSALPIEDVLITEAGRIATSLQLNNEGVASDSRVELQKTFWVIYHLETLYCFNTGRSGTIPISDISCSIPDTTLPQARELPWLRLLSEYSQVLSRTYDGLFSAKARTKSKQSIQAVSNELFEELESWRLSIPADLRPSSPVRSHRCGNLLTTSLAVHLHFSFHNVRIAILRAALQTCSDDTEKHIAYRQSLVDSAKGIAELVHLIPLEPFVSPWIQYHMPQSALFILFDLIIESPAHPETKKRLSYLQILVAFFARLGHTTGRESFSSVPSEFLQMATKFVDEMQYDGVRRLSHDQVVQEDFTKKSLVPDPGMTGDQDFINDDILSFQSLPFMFYDRPPVEDLSFLFADPGFADLSGTFGFQDFQTNSTCNDIL